MNKISGKVTLKESGLGIPDLIIVIYDVDPHTLPEETLVANQIGSGAMLSGLLGQPPIGDRLGSVSTDRDGNFALAYEDEEFRFRKADEKRPDLLLIVLAPEEAGHTADGGVLHISPVIRQNAGRTEAYLIRLTTEQLEKAGVPLPSVAPQSQETPHGVVSRLSTFEEHRRQIDEGLRVVAKKRVDTARADVATYQSGFRPTLLKSLSRLSDNIIAPERVVRAGERVLEKSNKAISHGITHVINSDDPTKRARVRGHLSLTAAQVEALQSAAGADGRVSGEELKRVLGDGQSETNATTLLMRQDPLSQICREMTTKEKECSSLLLDAGTPEDDDDGDPDGNGDGNGGGDGDDAGASIEPITAEDLNRHIGHLMQTMSSPEEKVMEGLTPMATRDEVSKNVQTLSLEKSPADMPAYHDFHNLQIAFEHVWQEAIDEGILDLAEDAYRIIVELGGTPPGGDGGGTGDPLGSLVTEGRMVNATHMQVRDHRTGDPGGDGMVVRDHRNGDSGTTAGGYTPGSTSEVVLTKGDPVSSAQNHCRAREACEGKLQLHHLRCQRQGTKHQLWPTHHLPSEVGAGGVPGGRAGEDDHARPWPDTKGQRH
jgi:hypothetical protein